MPHLITNDIQKAKIAHGNRVEKQKQDLLRYIEDEKAHLVYIDDNLFDPTVSEKQLGRYYNSADFERRLKTILPSNCFIISNPYRPGFRAIVRYSNLNSGKYETICPYESGIIPEHSVMQRKEVEIPDPDYISRKRTMERRDLPKHEWVPGQGFVFDDTTVRPGFIKVKQIGREIKRGWRTILIKLLTQKLVTVPDVERIFSADNTPNWARWTGRHTDTLLPW